MNPLNLETKGKKVYINEGPGFEGLFIDISDQFNSDNYDFYRTYLDDELYNSTCYLILYKTVTWTIFENQKTPGFKFTIANVPFYEDDQDYDCIGILISEGFLLSPFEEGTIDIYCYARGKYSNKPELKGTFGYGICTVKKFDDSLG